MSVARAVLGVTQVPNALGRAQFDVSSDGREVVYVALRPKADGSAYEAGLWLAAVGRPGQARRLAALSDATDVGSSAAPRFSPDGRRIAYVGELNGKPALLSLDTAGGDARAIVSPEVLKSAGLEGATPSLFAWSSDGLSLAVIYAPPPPPDAITGVQASIYWPWDRGGGANRLTVVDATSGSVRVFGDDDFDVTSLSWSPDGKRIAFSGAATSSHDRLFHQDLYVVDVATGATKPLVQLEGVDSDPVWSPDGRRIAFATQGGEGGRDWLQFLGIYDTATGQISYPGRAEIGAAMPRDFAWSAPDKLLFTVLHDLHAPVFELDAKAGRVKVFADEPQGFLSGLAVARTAHAVVLSREDVSRPSDLFITPGERYAPRPVTNLNPDLKLPELRMERIAWQSQDGRWPLKGVLFTPAGPPKARPLITIIYGGPAMVHLSYELRLQYPLHALIAEGYAVFLPNTRGRGGDSVAFKRALASEKGYTPGPYQDMMSGVDLLVRQGKADPNRLGVAGMSYGAVLGAYAVTRTPRFRAASVNDGTYDLRTIALGYAANPEFHQFWDALFGFSDPYDPAQAERMVTQTALASAREITTPLLVESGLEAFGGMDKDALQLFQAVCRFGRAPAEYVWYPRTGHGVTEPRLRLDSARRNLEWFGVWVLNERPQRPDFGKGCKP